MNCENCANAYDEGYTAGHNAENARLREQAEALKAAVLDIDAHSTAMGEDTDGFTTGGYIVSVGALHRALGVVGHAARKCKPGALCPPCAQTEALAAALEAISRRHPIMGSVDEYRRGQLHALEACREVARAALRTYREAVRHEKGIE